MYTCKYNYKHNFYFVTESRHPSGTANFPPPPTPITKPSVKIPYCKVSKLKKTIQPSSSSLTSSSASASTLSLSSSSSSSTTTTTTSSIPITGTKLNHTSIKQRTADQTSLSVGGTLSISSSSPRSPLESIPLQTSTTSCNVAGPSNVTVASTSGGSPGKSPGTSGNGSSSGQPRRKRLKTDRSLLKDREYDPDRHCGVWNDETGKPCTRSLTCKAHTVSLRRTVVGRSKTFDTLLAEHRAAKEQPISGGSSRQTTKVTVTGAVTVSSLASSLNNPHAPNTPVSIVEPEAPSSPPVLSLPDTYPLPKVSNRFLFCSHDIVSWISLYKFLSLFVLSLCSQCNSSNCHYVLMLQLVSTAQAIIDKRMRLLVQRRNESLMIVCD